MSRVSCLSYCVDPGRVPSGEWWGCAEGEVRAWSAGVPAASREGPPAASARRSRALDPLEVNAAVVASLTTRASA